MPTHTERMERVAMNIVYQLADEWKVDVGIRQSTNDKCIDFVIMLLASQRKELLEEVVQYIQDCKIDTKDPSVFMELISKEDVVVPSSLLPEIHNGQLQKIQDHIKTLL